MKYFNKYWLRIFAISIFVIYYYIEGLIAVVVVVDPGELRQWPLPPLSPLQTPPQLVRPAGQQPLNISSSPLLSRTLKKRSNDVEGMEYNYNHIQY